MGLKQVEKSGTAIDLRKTGKSCWIYPVIY